jgi:hypothetical protein
MSVYGNDTDKGYPKYLKENQFQRQIVHKKPGLTSNRTNHGISLHYIDNHTQRASVFPYVVFLSLCVFVTHVSR